MARRNRDRTAEYARNKAKRRIKGLEKELSSGRFDARSEEAIRNQIYQLQSTVEQSYVKNAPSKESRNAAIHMLENMNSSTPTQPELHKQKTYESKNEVATNNIFKQQMNMAQKGANVKVLIKGEEFTLTEEAVRAFYRATQKAWDREGVPVAKRLDSILNYYGYNSLSNLFAKVLAEGGNKDAIDLIRRIKQGMDTSDMTEEELALYEELQANDLDVTEARYQAGSIALNITQLPDPIAPLEN